MCIQAARDALGVLGPAHSEKSYEVSACRQTQTVLAGAPH